MVIFCTLLLVTYSNVRGQDNQQQAVTIVDRSSDAAISSKIDSPRNAETESQLESYWNSKFPCQVTHVKVTPDAVEINGDLNSCSGRKLLVEIPAWQSITDFLPATQLQSKLPAVPVFAELLEGGGHFKQQLPRHVASGSRSRDRLFSRWAVMQENQGVYSLLSSYRWPDEIESLHELSQLKPRSKKGLGGFRVGRGPIDDLDALEIASVTTNIKLDFLHASPGAGKAPFVYSGTTYYFNERAIGQLDATFQETSKRGIQTFGILLVPPPSQFADQQVGQLMVHPDYDTAGIFAMPNMVSAKGHHIYAAALDFLARRYSRPDKKYGRVHHWIAHNECDAGWEWSNAGRKSPREYLDLYYRSMRTIHNSVRQYAPHAQVFISLTHHWNWTSNKKYYHSKDLLDWLCKLSQLEGDFPWGVAHHPYPQSLFEPKTWEDAQAEFTLDTPLITLKNLEVLAAWSKDRSTWFRGQHPRTIYLTEQGSNSKDYSADQLEFQAAAMALAWKKLQALPEISGFHYHNWIDNRNEGGLRIGLRKFKDEPDDPLGEKPIWRLYRDLGTAQEDAACEFAKPLLGIERWSEVIHPAEIN